MNNKFYQTRNKLETKEIKYYNINMKKTLVFIIFMMAWSNLASAESSYDFFKKDLEYSSSKNIQTIYAHNSHPSKKILVEKMEVMFKACGSGFNWDNPDRVYLINETINPGTDKTITVNARYTVPTDKVCIRFWTKFASSASKKNPAKKFIGTKCLMGDEVYIYRDPINGGESYQMKERQTPVCIALMKKNKNQLSITQILQNPASWLITIGAIFLISFIINKNSQSKTQITVKKIKNKKTQISQNFISDVWEGNETLSKTFWMYVFWGGIIVGVLIGFIGGMTSQLVYILGAVYTIWSCVGLWRSSTNYKLAKLKAKQSYGWATAAKIYAVFNIIVWLSQLGLILSATI